MSFFNQFLASPTSVIILTVVLAIIPGAAWLIFYLVRYRKLKIPIRISIGVFILGIFSVFPSALFERLIIDNLSPTAQRFFQGQISVLTSSEALTVFLLAFLIAAPIEEFFKLMAIRLAAYKSNQFARNIDGVFMGILSGLAFAIVENIVYFFPLVTSARTQVLLGSFILRFFISTVAHSIYTGTAGYFLAKGKLTPLKKKRYFALAFIIPVLIHGFFNFFLFTKVVYYAIFLVVIGLTIVVRLAYKRINLEVKYRRGEVIEKPFFKDTEFTEEQFAIDKKFQKDRTKKEKKENSKEVYDICPFCYTPNAQHLENCSQCLKSLIKPENKIPSKIL